MPQSSVNPLLMTSNHPPPGHGPGLVSVPSPRPAVTPSSSAAVVLSSVSSTPSSSVPVSI